MTDTSDVYLNEDFARFYDWTCGDAAADIAFFLGTVKLHGAPVLEVGCGTGRVTIPLARDGIDVVGIDASPEMLKIARSKIAKEAKAVRDRIVLNRADMRVFDLGTAFPTVLVPAATVFHLTDGKAFDACFSRLAAHTRRRGVAVIDVVSPMLMASQKTGDARLVREGTNPVTRRHTQEWNRKLEIRREEQVVLVEHTFVEGRGGDAPRFRFEQEYRWIEKNEGIHMLQGAGFTDVRVLGDYDGSPYSDSSPRLILIAMRGGA